MNSSLIDISVTDLRGFIAYTDTRFGSQLAEMSLVSLKTRLQLCIARHHYKDFVSFNTYMQLNEKKHEAVLHELNLTPGELFRDYDSWMYLLDKIKASKKTTPLKIGLIESGNFTDLITFLILLDLNFLTKHCELTIIELFHHHKLKQTITFDIKEIETGVINYGKINRALVERYFTKKDKKAEYKIPFELPVQKFTECLEKERTFDIVIARNHTLVYNFTHHEVLFENYLNLLHRGSILFTGNKEGFKWCKKFTSIQSDELHPLYLKN